MRYSIQTIKYDLLYAIKEYDSDGSSWNIVTSPTPPEETLTALNLDVASHVFVGKPASTARAAELVREFLVQRFALRATALTGNTPNDDAHWVTIFRPRDSIVQQVEQL